MDSQVAYQPQFEPLKTLLLDLTRERSTGSLLRLVADRLAVRRDVALARVWLVAPGDGCGTCHRRSDCPCQARTVRWRRLNCCSVERFGDAG